MPMSNNGLSKLVEELGELQQVAGKMLAYGIECENHPDGGSPLVDRFAEESADVMAAIGFVVMKNLPDKEKSIYKRMDEKMKLFKQWNKEE